jgi:hypothetical protein
MKVYLISGYIGSGKSTAGILLQGLLPDAVTIAFGDAVKDDIAKVYKFDRRLCDSQLGKLTPILTPDDGTKTVRQLLIEHSAYIKHTTKDTGCWAKIVADTMSAEFYWIIHDWRYKTEYEVLKTRFPEATIITIRINRPGVTALNDPSEHDLDDYMFQYVLENTGTRVDLRHKLQSIIEIDHKLEPI